MSLSEEGSQKKNSNSNIPQTWLKSIAAHVFFQKKTCATIAKRCSRLLKSGWYPPAMRRDSRTIPAMRKTPRISAPIRAKKRSQAVAPEKAKRRFHDAATGLFHAACVPDGFFSVLENKQRKYFQNALKKEFCHISPRVTCRVIPRSLRAELHIFRLCIR